MPQRPHHRNNRRCCRYCRGPRSGRNRRHRRGFYSIRGHPCHHRRAEESLPTKHTPRRRRRRLAGGGRLRKTLLPSFYYIPIFPAQPAAAPKSDFCAIQVNIQEDKKAAAASGEGSPPPIISLPLDKCTAPFLCCACRTQSLRWGSGRCKPCSGYNSCPIRVSPLRDECCSAGRL